MIYQSLKNKIPYFYTNDINSNKVLKGLLQEIQNIFFVLAGRSL